MLSYSLWKMYHLFFQPSPTSPHLIHQALSTLLPKHTLSLVDFFHPHHCTLITATFVFHLDNQKPLPNLPRWAFDIIGWPVYNSQSNVFNENQTTRPPAWKLEGFPITPWMKSEGLSFARTLRPVLVFSCARLTSSQATHPSHCTVASLVPCLGLTCPTLAWH